MNYALWIIQVSLGSCSVRGFDEFIMTVEEMRRTSDAGRAALHRSRRGARGIGLILPGSAIRPGLTRCPPPDSRPHDRRTVIRSSPGRPDARAPWWALLTGSSPTALGLTRFVVTTRGAGALAEALKGHARGFRARLAACSVMRGTSRRALARHRDGGRGGGRCTSTRGMQAAGPRPMRRTDLPIASIPSRHGRGHHDMVEECGFLGSRWTLLPSWRTPGLERSMGPRRTVTPKDHGRDHAARMGSADHAPR